jgi:hypothetical protein
MTFEPHDKPPHSHEPFPVDDPVTGSVLSEDWGRMPEDDESLEGTLADVPQTGEPRAPDAPDAPPGVDRDTRRDSP